MLLFELITGQRPFETLTSGQEVNRAVLQRDRPQVHEGNAEPTFPAMVDLMEDCWAHLAADRPSGDEVCPASVPSPDCIIPCLSFCLSVCRLSSV